MTDDLRELAERLERATAQPSGPEGPLDRETAALREGWLAFAELLEAAQGAAQERLPASPPPLPRPDEGRSAPSVFPQARARSPWRAVAMAALAASLLLGLAVVWHAGRAKPRAKPSTLRIAESHPAPPDLPAKQTLQAAAETAIAWDDALDQRIEQAGWEMAQVRQDWLAAGATSGLLRYQIEQVRQEIEDSPL
jgi:hypothetical protein